jgi:FMN phosphatase YigB (HAD superfamily)
MTLTLLLDLDDTLLSNDIYSAFLPAYMNALGKHMAAFVEPNTMIQELLAATQVMLTNNSPAYTLEQAFDEYFYPAIGRTKEELIPVLEQFYDEVYPGLSVFTVRRPEAAHLLDYVEKQGHVPVIATNPLFPRKAILHRLRWAGLGPDTILFPLITTYENFHFAKPNPAYFAEILAQLGWPDRPAVVIGNSLEDDLIPAAKLNLPVFWVTPEPTALPEGFHDLSASGSLSDISSWLRKVEAFAPRQSFTTPPALLAVLKSTPAAFDSVSKKLTERQWKERPASGEWSLTEIFCHMRDVDREVNIPRFEKITSDSNPFVAGIDTDSWAEERAYYKENGPTALTEFIDTRFQLIQKLEGLDESEWQLPARHAIFGPTNIKELVSFITTHDRSHIQQVLATTKELAESSSQVSKSGL